MGNSFHVKKGLTLLFLGYFFVTPSLMAKDGLLDSVVGYFMGYEDKRSSGQKLGDRMTEISRQLSGYLKDNPDDYWIDIRGGARSNVSLQQASTLGVQTHIAVESKDRPVSLYLDSAEAGENKYIRGLSGALLMPIPEGSVMQRNFLYPHTKASYEMKPFSQHFDRKGNLIHTNGAKQPTFMLSEFEKSHGYNENTKVLETSGPLPDAPKFYRKAATREQLAMLSKALERNNEPDANRYGSRNALNDRGDELLLSQWLIGNENYIAKLIEQSRDKIGSEQLKVIEYKILDYEDYTIEDLKPRMVPNMKGSESAPYQVGQKLVIPIPAKGIRAGIFPSPHYFEDVLVAAGISKGTKVAIPALQEPEAMIAENPHDINKLKVVHGANGGAAAGSSASSAY